MKLQVTVAGRPLSVEVSGTPPLQRVQVEGRVREVDVRETGAGLLDLLVDGQSWQAGIWGGAGRYSILLRGRLFEVVVEEASAAEGVAARGVASGPARVTAPMPGRLVKVLVEPGQAVQEGDGLLVMEAMKMENELRSPRAGRVKELLVSERQAVETGTLLVVVD